MWRHQLRIMSYKRNNFQSLDRSKITLKLRSINKAVVRGRIKNTKCLCPHINSKSLTSMYQWESFCVTLKPKPTPFDIYRSHQIRHKHTRQSSSERVISLLQRPLFTQETSIPAFSRIQTHDSSNQAAAGLCLSPHGHRNWLVEYLLFNYKPAYFTGLHLFGMLSHE